MAAARAPVNAPSYGAAPRSHDGDDDDQADRHRDGHQQLHVVQRELYVLLLAYRKCVFFVHILLGHPPDQLLGGG